MSAFVNFAAYQLAWFAVVLGAARGLAWAGASVAILAALLHLGLRRDARELRLIGLSALIGLLVDSVLAITHQVHFAGWPLDVAPYWMLSLWMAFATTLNHSLRWLMSRPVAAALGGALGGPLAYLAGAQLGALSIPAAATALPLIALLWTAAMLALSMFMRRTSILSPPARVPA